MIDYDAMCKRINKRCCDLSISKVPGIEKDRLREILTDCHGISTLEVTHLHRALFVSILWIVFGKDTVG